MDEGSSDGRRFLLIVLGAVWLMAFVYVLHPPTLTSNGHLSFIWGGKA